MSQPFVYEPIKTDFASQGYQEYYPITRGQIKEIDRDAKIAKFEQDLPSLLKIQKQLLPPKEEGIVNIYYFIGRLNPPHLGHIETLSQLIQRAISENANNPSYKIIILLGSGPKKGNPLDNPLSFETKRDFITYKLKQLFPNNPPNFIFDTNVEILNMASAPSQISQITLQLVSDLIEEINMYRFSGAKDGDDEKLNWIETTIQKILKDYHGELTTSVVPVIPVTNEEKNEAMSATEVRLSILKGFLQKDLDRFFVRFKDFYGDEFSDKIAKEIAGVAEKVNDRNPNAVAEYISKKGGSKKSKRRKPIIKQRKSKRRNSKQRKTKKNRRLTKKRRY